MGNGIIQKQRWGGVTLILGGARSGKSRLGEAIVRSAAGAGGQSAVYIATALVTAAIHDDEMRQRIATHRARRGENWRTVEIPHDLSQELSRQLPNGKPILVDCLTLWLTNIMLADRDVKAEIEALAGSFSHVRAALVLVANETGLGIVPDNALARRFRDASGLMNQQIAAAADNVLFVAAGLPLVMKGRNPALEKV
ncbi:MAG: bifunctional adenosylcobinamide kinase/adenosylcobinamide-phosphate guanylyltransferase [Alphaproteobacteria bacterium]|jgi:adenosylcobinamide kinase/adenosylcobinamide-phosphate guanylyltransferase